LLRSQPTRAVIPVFLKGSTHAWEYRGRFRAYLCSTEPDDVARAKARRDDAVGILFMDEELDNDEDLSASDLEPPIPLATEGRRLLVAHFVRERRPNLIEARKRVERVERGVLTCGVCELTSDQLPAEIGEACFEVHHTVPLSDRLTPSPTRLADLALLCANCHRMIHRTDPLASPQELRTILSRRAR
jgi:predicted HNH restriction endonuclease